MDYIGKKFNRLTILDIYEKERISKGRKYKEKFVKCLCECGSIHHTYLYNVIKGAIKSCGCLRIEKAKRHENLIGKRFGRLVVKEKTNFKKLNNRSIVWLCVCDCGNEKLVNTTMLKSGKTRSCGCLAKEKIPETYFKSGELHHNWEGGITDIGLYVRERMKDWKMKSAYVCNYKCIISGEKFDVIHHLYPFNKILKECLNDLKINIKNKISEYSQEELDLIVKHSNELHEKYGLGVCITSSLHNEFHRRYGYKDFTPEDFREFYFLKTGKQLDLSIFIPNKLREVAS